MAAPWTTVMFPLLVSSKPGRTVELFTTALKPSAWMYSPVESLPVTITL